MSSIDEIVRLGENICQTMDRMIRADNDFALEMNIRLEQMEWEQIRWVNEIKAIKGRFC